MLPSIINQKLRRSHFLFLGYGLRDWNLRVILHRIWVEQKIDYQSWAVQLNSHDMEIKFWEKKGVQILEVNLDQYIQRLKTGLSNLSIKSSNE